jgi:hypothetical protein
MCNWQFTIYTTSGKASLQSFFPPSTETKEREHIRSLVSEDLKDYNRYVEGERV